MVVTGETAQLNFANRLLQTSEELVPYHAGEELPYDCGACHTTGYSTQGNQDGRAGMVGTFAFPGVQCEACHGAGSLHVNDPYSFTPQVDRDRQECTLSLIHILAVGNTQSPTERLWYTIVGLAAAVEVMDDRYSDDLIAEINEAVELGREWITRANGPW